MNRFDANFNDIDPVTSRPFSWGHPDGVWMIAIIYGFISLASFVAMMVGVVQLFSGGEFGVSLLLISGVALFLFLSTAVFLFKRSEKSISFAVTILALAMIGFVVTIFVAPESIVVALAVLCVQSYICYYIYGLKKDALLGKEIR